MKEKKKKLFTYIKNKNRLSNIIIISTDYLFTDLLIRGLTRKYKGLIISTRVAFLNIFEFLIININLKINTCFIALLAY